MLPNYPVHKTEKITKDFNEEYHQKFEKKENGNHKGRVLMLILLAMYNCSCFNADYDNESMSMEMVTSI